MKIFFFLQLQGPEQDKQGLHLTLQAQSTLKNAGLFQPKFGSNINKPCRWAD